MLLKEKVEGLRKVLIIISVCGITILVPNGDKKGNTEQNVRRQDVQISPEELGFRLVDFDLNNRWIQVSEVKNPKVKEQLAHLESIELTLSLLGTKFEQSSEVEIESSTELPIEAETEASTEQKMETNIEPEVEIEEGTSAEPENETEIEEETSTELEIETEINVELETETMATVEPEFESETLLYRIEGEYADWYDFSSMINEDNLPIVAGVGVAEAGNSTTEDITYAICVFLNRLRTNYSYFRNVHTVEEVLYQNYGQSNQQYGSQTIKKIEDGRAFADSSYPKCLAIARALVNGEIPCLYEGILDQNMSEPPQSWGLRVVQLPGEYHEVYSIPNDFEQWKSQQ